MFSFNRSFNISVTLELAAKNPFAYALTGVVFRQSYKYQNVFLLPACMWKEIISLNSSAMSSGDGYTDQEICHLQTLTKNTAKSQPQHLSAGEQLPFPFHCWISQVLSKHTAMTINPSCSDSFPFPGPVHLAVDYRQALAGSCGKRAWS